MRFRIGEKVYQTTALDEISLKDLVLFNGQAEEIGLSYRWHDVERLAQEFEELSEAEAEAHPDKLLLIAVTVWVARRAGGDVVTFGEAIDIPMARLEFLPDAEDKRPPKAKGGKKRPPKASAPAGARVTDDDPTPSTSEATSSTG